MSTFTAVPKLVKPSYWREYWTVFPSVLKVIGVVIAPNLAVLAILAYVVAVRLHHENWVPLLLCVYSVVAANAYMALLNYRRKRHLYQRDLQILCKWQDLERKYPIEARPRWFVELFPDPKIQQTERN